MGASIPHCEMPPAKRGHGLPSESAQGAIENGGALALEEAELANRRGDGDRGAGAFGQQEFRCLLLEVIADRGEDAGDGDGCDPARADVGADALDLGRIEARDGGAVEVDAPLSEVAVLAHHPAQVVGPVDHGRQTLRGRQAQANDRGGRETASLDDGIGEMGGADHH